MAIEVGQASPRDPDVGRNGFDRSIDAKLMLGFEGIEMPKHVRSLLRERDVAGFTLFRFDNVQGAAQLRALTAELQGASGGETPLLIAADQEGGQLIGLGEETTPFAGNMAIGAAGDPSLAERIGRAMGLEMRALGVNVNYAPVCDVATNPDNPALGVRSFGDDPGRVGQLAAAMVRGLQAEGVAATLKHFPGMGEARTDPHRDLPVIDLDRERLDSIEIAPFRAGIAEEARMVMVGHHAVPSISGRPDLPASVSPDVIRLLRGDLGFDGVVITDALDMASLAQGSDSVVEAIAAVRAGADLVLCAGTSAEQDRIRSGLSLAASRGLVDGSELDRSVRRVDALRRWVAGFAQPDLGVVGSAEHRALARELAERSVTLVRNEAGMAPLRLRPDGRLAAIMPGPRDLTPADTSSTVTPALAAALRRRHPRVDEFVAAHPPVPAEIADLRDRISGYDLVVVGTIDAARFAEQGELVAGIMSTGVPTIVIALRTPHDLVAFLQVSTYICTYSVHPSSVEAAVAALWGELPFKGRLPAAIPGICPTGHGLNT
ncbi:MAG: glycoside hydrolase family 3 protein [Actinomycetota bacterium]